MKEQISIFNYDNLKLEYIKIDNKAKKNLVFLHGFSSEFYYFKDLYDDFKDFNIYGLNMPGHGNSEFRDESMNLIYFGKIFEAFIEFLNIDKLTLIGHSMGGGLAMMSVPKLNKLIEKIVLIGPMSRSGLSRVEVFEECFFPKNIKEYEKLLNLCYFDPSIIINNKEIMKGVEEYLINNKSLDAVYKLGHSLPNLENMDSIESGIEMFKKPLLLIYGEADGIIDLDKINQYYLDHKKDTQIEVINKAGHSIWKENKQDFLLKVKNFFKQS